jgi:four helix bundle protein
MKMTFRALDLAVSFHEEVTDLNVQGHLRDQLLRAASSVALNLTEGNAKFSAKEKRRYYQVAYGSLKECETILRMLSIKEREVNKTADHLGASLYKLVRSNLKGR